MEFSVAAKHVLRFGKHAGKTLDQIASSDDGLLYLDWLVGQPWLQEPARGAIESYLGDPSIARDLEKLVD